jgi:hypothetical protein
MRLAALHKKAYTARGRRPKNISFIFGKTHLQVIVADEIKY